MQVSLDSYPKTYNESRPHQERGMKGRTLSQVFKAGIKLLKASKKKTTKKTTDTQPAAA